MKTIILAGGFSTRLYPKTEFFPKSLLQIQGKEIVEYLIEDLLSSFPVSQKENEIILISNNRYFKIFEKWLKEKHPQIKILNNGVDNSEKRLGAIGDILFVLNKTKWEDDLLVLSSDTLSSLKLKEFIGFFKKKRGVINAIFDTKNINIIKNKLGCVKINSKNEITEFIEKPENPQSTLTSIPYYIFPKKDILLIKKYQKQGGNLDAPGSIISWLIGKTKVYAFQVHGFYFDVGTNEIYDKLQKEGINY